MMKKCVSPDVGKLLHAYELKKLSAENNERFEIHLLECDHCFKEVNEFDKVSNLMTTEKKIRVAVREAVDGTPATESLLSKILEYLWPDTRLVLKPALSYLVIAFLIYPAYLGLKIIDENQIRSVQVLNLIPERSIVEPVKAGSDILLSFVFGEAEVGKSYRITIKSDDSDIVFQADSFSDFDEFGIARLLLPAKKMKPGSYSLFIVDPKGDPPLNKQEYTFKIEK